jgi:membrane fusion protein, multidrug efflux system
MNNNNNQRPVSSDSQGVAATSKTNRRKSLLVGLGSAVALAALASSVYHYGYASHFVSTDNAYAAVEVAQVTPSVGGTIIEVLAKDTQQVKAGDVLVKLDPTDARLALAQAEAEYQRAIRRVKGYVANDGNLSAQISARAADVQRAVAQLKSAEADFERAKIDLDRRDALKNSGSISGEELTRAQNTFVSARSALSAAQALLAQAKANVESAKNTREANAVLIADALPESNPETLLAKARRDQAFIDLERTTVKAPVSGVVAKRSVQLGQRVSAGAPLLSVVPVQDMHVDANFKEVQLGDVRLGQPVTLHADVYGSAVTYHGVVEGFSGGSGAAFSAIPAQNATGNWIKVVQRLPVRVKLDPQELAQHPLKVGLSMSASIDTRPAE